MKNVVTVHYTRDFYNPHASYFANQNRYRASKVFNSLDDARAFAATVCNPRIVSATGKTISLA